MKFSVSRYEYRTRKYVMAQIRLHCSDYSFGLQPLNAFQSSDLQKITRIPFDAVAGIEQRRRLDAMCNFMAHSDGGG